MSVYTWSIERTDGWFFRYYAVVEDRKHLIGLRQTVLCVTLSGARRWIRRQEKKLAISEAEPVESGTFEIERKTL